MHSCLAHSVEDHFEGKDPALRSMFDCLRRNMERFGPIRIDAVQSNINLAGKYHFAGVTVLKDRLKVGFLLHRRLEHPRIIRTQKVDSNKYSHFVKLARREDIDKQFLAWMKEAYSLRK